MKHFKKYVVGLGIAIAVSGATVAFAQDEVVPETPEIPEAVATCLEFNKLVRDTAIAEALGITVEEFQEKRDSGMSLRDIAEELGVDVPDRSDIEIELEDCRAIAHEEVLASAAEQLGMTVDELQALLDEGMTLRDIAEEQGVELDLPFVGPGPRGSDGPRDGGPGNFGGRNNDGPGNFDGPRNGGPGRGPRGGGNTPEAPAAEDTSA